MNHARVLYIDDELDLLELAVSFFADENIPLSTCSDYNVALEMIRGEKFDVVISDAELPFKSGPELFRTLLREGFKGKMILVSGNVQNESEIREIGYTHVFYKPLDFIDLTEKVKALL